MANKMFIEVNTESWVEKINVNHIISFSHIETDDEASTLILLSNGKTIYVKENPVEIQSKINALS